MNSTLPAGQLQYMHRMNTKCLDVGPLPRLIKCTPSLASTPWYNPHHLRRFYFISSRRGKDYYMDEGPAYSSPKLFEAK
jgi:hypothetical protein